VNVRAGRAIRDAFHRARTFAPQRPLERPAPEFPGSAAWPPRFRFSTPFHPREALADSRGPGPRPRAPLPTGDTLLWTSASLADFCNLKQRAGTPNERSILAREWSFRSATRRHQPMPVALARDTLPHREPASLDLHAPACARRVPLAWTGQMEGRSVRGKASRALLDDVARALLVAPRAPYVAGSIRDEAWRTPSLAAPAETPL
jgi:hypothetical protein